MAQLRGHWKDQLREATRHARAEQFGFDKIIHRHHALLITTALQAFGDEPSARFYVESLPQIGSIPRPDLILIHPHLGVLVIENKGIALEAIHAVDGQSLTIERDGMLKTEDPFFQAERVMFKLKDQVSARTSVESVLFNRTAALPAINRGEFERRFGVSWPREALFRDDFESAEMFARRVREFCAAEKIRSGRVGYLTPGARDVAVEVLNGRGTLYSRRSTLIEETDERLLGVQAQKLETVLKRRTQQQHDLGRLDLRGQHRLFRGVAGSGKSLLLAAAVARSILRSQEQTPSLFETAVASPRPWRVLAVCFNRTLVHYLKSRIDDEYARLAWGDLPAGALTVTHFEGVIRALESQAVELRSGLSFRTEADKRRRATGMVAAIDRLDPPIADALLYDAVFLDEAQDMQPEEIQLLLRLARRDEAGNQTFAVFYDNAQNIYGVPTPVWEKLGVNIVGRTTFMDQCMRNTRQTLELAFNVLVGSFAATGVRVTTRQFADVASLRERDLITESGDRFEVHFARRTEPTPVVRTFANGIEESEAAVETVRWLLGEQRVLPSDILILYPSHASFKKLPADLVAVIAEEYGLRTVDKDHDHEKNLPLLQDRILTLSTIASAKGYDAAIVVLLGADLLTNDTRGRASFYVAATRAKVQLFVFGTRPQGAGASLLDEIVMTAKALQPPPTN